MRGLEIRSSQLPNGWHCIAVHGEIDLATVPQLESAIDSVFEADSTSLVIDLTSSSFMDSTGLKAVVMANRRYHESGREFALAISGGPVSRLIDLSGVDASIRIIASTDDLEA